MPRSRRGGSVTVPATSRHSEDMSNQGQTESTMGTLCNLAEWMAPFLGQNGALTVARKGHAAGEKVGFSLGRQRNFPFFCTSSLDGCTLCFVRVSVLLDAHST
ncbi:unnamed protein product [Protopolystoma xenopodis]|uniref:Uncharacterized protein n=1 Tax=Protopolystoma xenopodis TaxID=117903 RepID=A0A448WNT8_9PLAT|nr:unnamed protein product [Protopolystoma xenopodis]